MSKFASVLDGKSLSRIHSDWACLVGQSHRLGDEQFREEALGFALQLMVRVRSWAAETVEALQKSGYRFVYPERAILDPDSDASDWVRELRQKGVHLSLAFEAWLRVIGGVNLMGTHPSWSRSAYAFDDSADRQEPIYTDPLVVEMPKDYANYLYDEWLEARSQSEAQSPFRVEIAPDHLHKANVSGGLPYQLSAGRPAVDGFVWNERHGIGFVGYLRKAIEWGGFPGFDYLDGENLGWHRRDKSQTVI